MSIDTPSMTARGVSRPARRSPYPTMTSASCSNTHTDHGRASERREAQRFFVRLVEEIRDTRIRVDAARHAERSPDGDHGIPRIRVQRGREIRLDVADLAATIHDEER